MPSLQEQARIQVLEFVEAWKSKRDNQKPFIANHFNDSGDG